MGSESNKQAGWDPVQDVPPNYSADHMNVAIYARRYMHLILRRWLVVLLCLAGALGIAIYRAVSTPDIYQSYSMVGVAPRVQASYTSQVQYQEAVENYYSDQIARMNSGALLARVANKALPDAVAAGKNPVTLARAVRAEGSFLRMNVQGTDFDSVQAFAATWAKEFIASRDEEKNSAFRTKAESTREQIARNEERLRSVQQSLLDFLQKNNISSVKDLTEAAQQRLDSLISEYNSIKMRRQRLEALSKEDIASGALQDGLRPGGETTGVAATSNASTPAQAGRDFTDPLAKFAAESEYSRLKLEMHTKTVERATWLKTLKPKHPKMEQIDQELGQLQARVEYALDLIRQKQEAQVKSLKGQESTYPDQIAELQRQVRNYAGVMHDYNKLKEEEKIYLNELSGLNKSLSELESTISAGEDQWKISESGAGSRVPIGPNRTRIVLTGLMAGIGLALSLVYLLHRMDDRLDLAEDIERELEEPVLGQIPQIQGGKGPNQRVLITSLPAEDMFAESIRGVRSTILMTLGSGSKKVLLVTSAVPGDGKTTFTSNFACTLAVTGARVLLIDADLRRGSSHLFFELSRDTGLSDALQGRASWLEVVKDTKVPNLQVITTGSLPSNPGELLVGSSMSDILIAARNLYDYVIVDTPPLTGINDTFAMVRQSDGLIFVVRAGRTSMKFARTALTAVRQREARIIGVVLNGITADNPYYYYHYYYHAYYAKDRRSKSAPASPGRSAPAAQESLVSKARTVPAVSRTSIDAEAKSLTGEPVSTRAIAAAERAKIDQYKARRAARKNAAGVSGEPGTDPGSGVHIPKSGQDGAGPAA